MWEGQPISNFRVSVQQPICLDRFYIIKLRPGLISIDVGSLETYSKPFLWFLPDELFESPEIHQILEVLTYLGKERTRMEEMIEMIYSWLFQR